MVSTAEKENEKTSEMREKECVVCVERGERERERESERERERERGSKGREKKRK